MTLPFGVEESIVPGVLASKFPLRALQMLGGRSMTQEGLENS
jgi:hypothetical protein